MNTQTLKPDSYVDQALPYALFFLGLIVPFVDDRIMAITVTPVHEIGHVLAAFATGGYGVWDIGNWTQAFTYGGNRAIILHAGVFFALIFNTAVPMVLVLYRKLTFLAGVLFSSGYIHAMLAHNQQDWLRTPQTVPIANRALDIMMVICVILMIGALVLSIAKVLSKRAKTVAECG